MMGGTIVTVVIAFCSQPVHAEGAQGLEIIPPPALWLALK
jgi:hypothetical protein